MKSNDSDSNNNKNRHNEAQQRLWIGNKDDSSQTLECDTRLSPYLRWGVISPRQAYHSSAQQPARGVRTRDLLWRDWSHMCHRTVQPLRQGRPVLPYLDGCCHGPCSDNNNHNHHNNKDDAPPLADKDPSLLFASWCLGRTGYPLVDAGMKQLWHQGWMPRRIRLLAACCLVEGLGLDWRRGRDWFEYTLIDHDPAINELMWQNAGYCGIDLFYRGLSWETSASKLSSDDQTYVDQWAWQVLKLPTHLREQNDLLDQDDGSVLGRIQNPKERRQELQRRGVYKAAAKVANSGVRVRWNATTSTISYNDNNNNNATTSAPENKNDDTGKPAEERPTTIAPGEVWGVGRTPLEELTFDHHAS